MKKIYNVRFWTFGGWFTMMWVGIGTAVLGAGASLYGANKQAKAVSSANDANQAAQADQNNSAWTSWLMSKGVQPTSPVTAGQVPGAGGYTAVNTRLPLWASMNVAAPGAKSRWQKVGAGYGAANTLAATPAATTQTGGGAAASAVGSGGGGANRTASVAGNLLDPTGITGTLLGGGPRTIGSVIKNSLDPLGIFCWVAREVYGEENPLWQKFRDWLLHRAPVELRDAYWINGPALAARAAKDPSLKSQIRSIMDGIISLDKGTP